MNDEEIEGTTAEPKLVAISHFQLLNGARAVVTAFGIKKDVFHAAHQWSCPAPSTKDQRNPKGKIGQHRADSPPWRQGIQGCAQKHPETSGQRENHCC
ncbi:hypothetical protein ANCDUO_18299 [Ancylostoma duodenale]|uniref:Uncharacterized protein n=1 Tax=Ancylostoma duodenale TaxID=51022 RepID=A0A0C2C5R4_9BILA|nr:hypothetical protein ANCDUO_18299 [Ancylostoma duodenale]